MENTNKVRYRLLVKSGLCQVHFSPSDFRLILNGQAGKELVNLGYSECKVLEFLVSSAGATLSRDEIVKYAWPDRVVGSGSLNQCIFNLRRALGDDRAHDVIQTVPRRGYRLNPECLAESTVNEGSLIEKVENYQAHRDIESSELSGEHEIDMSSVINSDQGEQKNSNTSSPNFNGHALVILFFSLLLLLVEFLGFRKYAAVYIESNSLKDALETSGAPSQLDEKYKRIISRLGLEDASNLWVFSDKGSMQITCIKEGKEALNFTIPNSSEGPGKLFTEALEKCLG